MNKSIRRAKKQSSKRGTRRSRIGKLNMKRNSSRVKRLIRGGIKNIEALRNEFGLVDGGDNLYKIWSALFYKKTKGKEIVITNPSTSTSKHLYVIDMQNDFVDRAMGDDMEQLGGPPYGDGGRPIGSFAVGQGKDMIQDIIRYIQAANTSESYKNIVLSRDYHPQNHCSFGKPSGGYFPIHCVQNTVGAEFIPELNNIKTELERGGKTKVIFKGFDPDTDSFSASPFNANQTSSGPNCKCKTKSCSGDTIGGYTITGDSWVRNSLVNKENATKFVLTPEDGDVIEVCGLAGDYCVRDTAIALKTLYPNCEVIVLNNLTRYAFLPTQIFLDTPTQGKVGVGNFPQHRNEKLKDQEAKSMGPQHLSKNEIIKFSQKNPEKGINYYLFSPPPSKLLDSKFLEPEATLKVSEKDIKEGKYFHFITDHNTIIDDYLESRVKVYIPKALTDEIDRISLLT